jgi:hypothetical protein
LAVTDSSHSTKKCNVGPPPIYFLRCGSLLPAQSRRPPPVGFRGAADATRPITAPCRRSTGRSPSPKPSPAPRPRIRATDLFFRITAAQTEFDRQRDQPRVAHILHAAMTAMRIRTGLRGNATGLWTLPLLNSDIENHRGETRAGNLGLQRETPGIPGQRPDFWWLTSGNVGASVSTRDPRRETSVVG